MSSILDLMVYYQNLITETGEVMNRTDFGLFQNYSYLQCKRFLITNSDDKLTTLCQLKIDFFETLSDAKATVESCKRIIEYNNTLDVQSQFLGQLSDGGVQAVTKDENFTDVMGEHLSVEPAGNKDVLEAGNKNVNQLQDYLARPVQVYKTDLAIGADWSIRLRIWDLFSTVPSVRAKLRNYAYFRGDINVRISISGTPFHAGKVLVSYQPYCYNNQALATLLNAYAGNSGMRRMVLNYLSQAEGSVVMDVRDNAPMEMICPFISTKPVHNLYNDSTAVISGSFTDFYNAGDLFIYTVNPLRAVSDTPSPVYIQVYAWVNDVELGTNTATQVAITTEADERKIGPVERVASGVFSVAKALEKVPFLSPFATATRIFAGAARGIAAIFGWSRPVIIQNAGVGKNLPFTNTAITIGNSTAERLVLDPMQELRVDSRAVAIDEDHMVISKLASRMSYLTTFNWAVEDVAMGTSIWNCRVHPYLSTVYTGTKYFIQPTAMAFAVAPFYYWRGDITFRIEVVSSAFHRGKLAIYYEPNNLQYTLINASLSLNKQFIKVIDIQETQTVELTVKWAGMRQWLKNMTALESVQNTVLTTPVTGSFGFCNGYIGIVPFTELQSPDGTGVQVNVYVCSPNLQVNGFCSNGLPLERDNSVPVPPGLLLEAQSETSDRKTCKYQVDVTEMDLNESTATTDNICIDHFGEQPLSFRSLLKRYQTVYTNAHNVVSTNNSTNDFVRNIMPDNNLRYGSPLNVQLDMFSYLRLAYLGVRGSVRYIIYTTMPTERNYLGQVSVTLIEPSTSSSNATTITAGNIPVLARPIGTIKYLPHTNGGIEFELPYYSNNLFSLAFSETLDDAANNVGMEKSWFRRFRVNVPNIRSDTSVTSTTQFEFATGEDFTFMRFVGAPYFSSALS